MIYKYPLSYRDVSDVLNVSLDKVVSLVEQKRLLEVPGQGIVAESVIAYVARRPLNEIMAEEATLT